MKEGSTRLLRKHSRVSFRSSILYRYPVVPEHVAHGMQLCRKIPHGAVL